MGANVQIISTLIECKKYKDNIISSIIEILSNHNYETELNDNETEIHIKTNDLSSVNTIISDELESVPDNVKKVLIDTYRTKEGVYIRLKFK